MKGTLLDANLLCLLVVGRINSAKIARHPRLSTFEAEDFSAVTEIVDRRGELLLCPHVLAETSNLLAYRQSAEQRARLRYSMRELIGLGVEHTRPAVSAAGDPAFMRLGMTDAVLLVLASSPECLLLSDDLDLCIEAGRRGLDVINYSHVRDGAVRIDQT